MSRKHAKLIRKAFDLADAEFPDKSTEFIISITADRLGIDYMEVVDALAMLAE